MTYLFRWLRWFWFGWIRRLAIGVIGVGMAGLITHHWWAFIGFGVPSRAEIDRWIRKRGRHAR